MSLFVPLDVDYADDDKILEAGYVAELLFVRSLAFSKRKMTDGKIARSQLAIVGRGIPNLSRHVDVLIVTGLWTETAGGWVITSWLKRNRSAAQIKDVQTRRQNAATEANHKRWHVGKDGKRSATCPLCASDPTSVDRSVNRSIDRSTESEAETEPYTEPETYTEPEPEEETKNPASVKPNITTAASGLALIGPWTEEDIA